MRANRYRDLRRWALGVIIIWQSIRCDYKKRALANDLNMAKALFMAVSASQQPKVCKDSEPAGALKNIAMKWRRSPGQVAEHR